MSRIHVIHENATWSEPLFAALTRRGLPHDDWFLDRGCVHVDDVPPRGVFYNRMSASSHTRDHRYAPEYTAATLMWLESHGRRVLNTSRSLTLELSKAAQYSELRRFGIKTPLTVAAVGRDAIIKAADKIGAPLILKPNRAGKGAGVILFRDLEGIGAHLDSEAYDPPVDGVTLVQRFIEAPEPFIVRVEFVGRRLLYAVRVDTSEGFELCPADVCNISDQSCPVGTEAPRPKFEILPSFSHPFVEKYQAFMRENGIHIAACEFIVDAQNTAYTYDVNMNVNYNSDAEAAAGMSGMDAIAEYLGTELREQR